MTRWLVIVPEGDEVKYARNTMLTTDKVIVVDLDAVAAKLDAPLSDGVLGVPGAPFHGIPLYDVEID